MSPTLRSEFMALTDEEPLVVASAVPPSVASAGVAAAVMVYVPSLIGGLPFVVARLSTPWMIAFSLAAHLPLAMTALLVYRVRFRVLTLCLMAWIGILPFGLAAVHEDARLSVVLVLAAVPALVAAVVAYARRGLNGVVVSREWIGVWEWPALRPVLVRRGDVRTVRVLAQSESGQLHLTLADGREVRFPLAVSVAHEVETALR